MLIDSDKTKTRSFESNGDRMPVADADQPEKKEASLPSEADLFDLYEEIVQNRPGTRDAEIFEKIHEWSFSNFSLPPHEFAGITAAELKAWQARHRINLSSGHIRPAHIDLARGHAWGQIRRDDHANGRHTQYGPPSVEEIMQMMMAGPR
jgi:hypothetical protein